MSKTPIEYLPTAYNFGACSDLREYVQPPVISTEDKLLALQKAVTEYLLEWDNPVADSLFRRQLRDRLRILVEFKK